MIFAKVAFGAWLAPPGPFVIEPNYVLHATAWQVVSSRSGSSWLLMTKTPLRIDFWSKSCAKDFILPLSPVNSSASKHCLDSVQLRSWLSSVSASCSCANSCRVGILKSSGTSPSHEIGMSTSDAEIVTKLHANTEVEFKLHNFASDSHHCSEALPKSIP